MNFSHLSSPYFHSGLSQMIISNKIIKISPESRYQSKNNSKISYESPITTSNSIFNESHIDHIDDFLLPNIENLNKKNMEISKSTRKKTLKKINKSEENTHKKIQDILFELNKSVLFDVDKLGLKKEKLFLPYINAENDEYMHQNLNRFFVFRSSKNKFSGMVLFY